MGYNGDINGYNIICYIPIVSHKPKNKHQMDDLTNLNNQNENHQHPLTTLTGLLPTPQILGGDKLLNW